MICFIAFLLFLVQKMVSTKNGSKKTKKIRTPGPPYLGLGPKFYHFLVVVKVDLTVVFYESLSHLATGPATQCQVVVLNKGVGSRSPKLYVKFWWPLSLALIRVILRCWGNSSMVSQQNSDAL